jgi:hypothetical protein
LAEIPHIGYDSAADQIFRFLSTTGATNGAKNANGNYALAPEEFYIIPAAGEVFLLNQFTVYIEDTNDFRGDFYGDTAPLSSGIDMKIQVAFGFGGSIFDFLDKEPIKTVNDWLKHGFKVDYDITGFGNRAMAATYNFTASGKPAVIRDNQKFAVTVQDNLTGLVAHYFSIRGVKATMKNAAPSPVTFTY